MKIRERTAAKSTTAQRVKSKYKQRLHGKSPFSENHSFAMAAKDRFSSVSEEDLAKIKDDCRAESTVKATRCWSSLFLSYIEQKKIEIDFKTCSATELADILKKFYVEVRRQDGSVYQRSSIRGMRAAIHRFIREPPYSRMDLSLFRDNSAFDEANDILDAQLRVLKKRGELKATRHYPPICSSDLEKIGRFIKTTLDEPIDATNLTLAGWFILTFHLGLRGREMQLELRKQDLLFSKNENGKEIVELSTSFAQKNHAGSLSSLSGDVSSGQVQDPVQVAIIRKLVALSNPKVDRIFQRAGTRKRADDPYFVAAPPGKDTLAKFMTKISERAGFSQLYTNHSVRAACVTVLQSHNIEDRYIASVTMHKNISSLALYGRQSDQQKTVMARAIDESPGSCSKSGSATSAGPSPSHDRKQVSLTDATETVEQDPSIPPALSVTGQATFQGCTFHFSK